MTAISPKPELPSQERHPSFKSFITNPFNKVKEDIVSQHDKVKGLDNPVLNEILSVLQGLTGQIEEQNFRLELIEMKKVHDAYHQHDGSDNAIGASQNLPYERELEYTNEYEKSILRMRMLLEEGHEDEQILARQKELPCLPVNVRPGNHIPSSLISGHRQADVYSLSVYTDVGRLASKFSFQGHEDICEPSTPSSSAGRSPNSDEAPTTSSRSSIPSHDDDRCATSSSNEQWNSPCVTDLSWRHSEVGNETTTTTLETKPGQAEDPEAINISEINAPQSISSEPIIHPSPTESHQVLKRMPVPYVPLKVPDNPRAELCYHAYNTWKFGVLSTLRAEAFAEQHMEKERFRCSVQGMSASGGKGWRVVILRVYHMFKFFRGTESGNQNVVIC